MTKLLASTITDGLSVTNFINHFQWIFYKKYSYYDRQNIPWKS